MPVFRVDKTKDYTVMSNHHLRNEKLSLKAKGLLSLMLSLPETWDYTLGGLTKISTERVDAIRTTVNELEKHGYLTRRRIRNEKGHLTDTEYTILECPVLEKPMLENPMLEESTREELTSGEPTWEEPMLEKPTLDYPTLENPTLEKPTLGKPTLENPMQLSTYRSSTKELSTYPINPDAQKTGMDGLRATIHQNIDYDKLKPLYGDQLDGLVSLMLETLSSDRKKIRIAGDDRAIELVRERLFSL